MHKIRTLTNGLKSEIAFPGFCWIWHSHNFVDIVVYSPIESVGVFSIHAKITFRPSPAHATGPPNCRLYGLENELKTHGQSINELVPGQLLKVGKVALPAPLKHASRDQWRDQPPIGGSPSSNKTHQVGGIYDSGAIHHKERQAHHHSIQAAMRAAEALSEQHHARRDRWRHSGLISRPRRSRPE